MGVLGIILFVVGDAAIIVGWVRKKRGWQAIGALLASVGVFLFLFM